MSDRPPFTADHAGVCPRCAAPFDTRFPALSRTDNKTHICSQCGMDEGMEAYLSGGQPPVSDQKHWKGTP